MALPTLDATFASSADLPRKQMLAKWLVEELGSGSIAEYYSLPERYLWAKIAVAAGAPKTEADYISLPKNYAWSDIYNAVSGDIANSTVVVSGLSDSQYNGNYVYDGNLNERPSYRLNASVNIYWTGSGWDLYDTATDNYINAGEDVAYPWLVTVWLNNGIDPTGVVLTPQTPNHIDWSENVALGHIAAAYRGDTANPANLATYIDWPWRYKVAAIIDHLIGNYNAVIVSGAGSTDVNGTYALSGQQSGKNKYVLDNNYIEWNGAYPDAWTINNGMVNRYVSLNNTEFPWDATFETDDANEPPPTLTPTNV